MSPNSALGPVEVGGQVGIKVFAHPIFRIDQNFFDNHTGNILTAKSKTFRVVFISLSFPLPCWNLVVTARSTTH